MPFGRYTAFGEGGKPVQTEEFRCAPGPMGWRYFSQVEATDPSPHHETLDFAIDADSRIARMRIATGEHDILLEPGSDGTTLTGYRDNEPIEIPYGPDVHLDYFTPATNAITARRLTGTTEIDVVYLEPVTLDPTRVRPTPASSHRPRSRRRREPPGCASVWHPGPRARSNPGLHAKYAALICTPPLGEAVATAHRVDASSSRRAVAAMRAGLEARVDRSIGIRAPLRDRLHAHRDRLGQLGDRRLPVGSLTS